MRRRATSTVAPTIRARTPTPAATTTPEAPVLASEDFEGFEEVEPLLEEVTFCDKEPEVFGAVLSFFCASDFKESAGALD